MSSKDLVDTLYDQYMTLQSHINVFGDSKNDKKNLKALKRVIRYNVPHTVYKAMNL